jgi:hypothetical protein
VGVVGGFVGAVGGFIGAVGGFVGVAGGFVRARVPPAQAQGAGGNAAALLW